MADFKLSATLKGHEDDVRGVAFCGPHMIVSASRDATGSEFVNSVAYVPPSSAYADGLIVSGGKDTIIDVRQPGRTSDSDAERLLLGHQGNVCALDAFTDSKTSYLISGSWDSSARIWDFAKAESTATLEGHSGSVWAVLAYDHARVITGCADHNIRVFSTAGKLLNTISGSADVVRALCKLPDNHGSGAQFASAGNDSVIRLWTLEGREVAQLHGHDNFIYSLDVLPTGELVSSGEDRTVRIWKDGQNIQTITHPAISVWAVAASRENGDIVTGASDRIVRVFTRAAERRADAQALAAFEDSVTGSSIPQQSMGDINKEKLPGPEFLQQKSGTKEGQVQMIREANGNISAHQWSHLAGQWVNVGTVVDSAGSSGRRQEYLGQDYDYVFDVDIEDGKPPLKLPYNLSQNPYEVARKFVADHELPLSYLDQVANFIIQNTQGATLNQSSSSAAVQSQPATQSRPKVLPQKDFLTITQANFSLIGRKVQELNGKLVADGHKDVSFNPSEVKAIPAFVQALEAAVSKPASSPELAMGANMAVRIATQWPAENRLPGVDLLRGLAAADPALTSQHNVIEILEASTAFPSASSGSAGNPNLTMLGIRALANLFAHAEGRSYIKANMQAAHAKVAPFMQASAGAVNRNIHIAATTFYINLAVLLGQEADGSGMAPGLLADLAALLGNAKVVDSETAYRALVAVGTLVRIPGARDKDAAAVEAAVKAAGGRFKEPRIRGVIDEMTTTTTTAA